MIALHYYLVVPIKKTTDKNKKGVISTP